MARPPTSALAARSPGPRLAASVIAPRPKPRVGRPSHPSPCHPAVRSALRPLPARWLPLRRGSPVRHRKRHASRGGDAPCALREARPSWRAATTGPSSEGLRRPQPLALDRPHSCEFPAFHQQARSCKPSTRRPPACSRSRGCRARRAVRHSGPRNPGAAEGLLLTRSGPLVGTDFVTADDKAGVVRVWNVSQRSPKQMVQAQQGGGFHAVGFVASSERLLGVFKNGAVGLCELARRRWVMFGDASHTDVCRHGGSNPGSVVRRLAPGPCSSLTCPRRRDRRSSAPPSAPRSPSCSPRAPSTARCGRRPPHTPHPLRTSLDLPRPRRCGCGT